MGGEEGFQGVRVPGGGVQRRRSRGRGPEEEVQGEVPREEGSGGGEEGGEEGKREKC